MAIKSAIPLVALLLAGSLASGRTARFDHVRIGVLGLFHPRQLTVTAPQGAALVMRAGHERIVLERSSGVSRASVRVSGNGLVVQAGVRVVRGLDLELTGREGQPVDILLGIPGKITRHYRGTIEITPATGILIAVVDMDLETAVASVVNAENPPGTPLEALKAQAVASRSYLVAARGRHHDFDFCDTTHCQFLREPPASDSAVATAVSGTRSLVVAYAASPIAAMYTRSCSGQTRTPAEVGLSSAAYPYYSVACKYCREHPTHWRSRIPAEDAAALPSSSESARLAIDRRLGWSTVPSSNFTMKKEGGNVVLEGTGEGHGIGLCQAGARAMAQEGANFRQILAHYYPNTTVVNMERIAASVH